MSPGTCLAATLLLLAAAPAPGANAPSRKLRPVPFTEVRLTDSCLEAVDNGGKVSDLALPRDAKLEAAWLPSFPGGAMVLRGRGRRASPADWEGALYRDSTAGAPVDMTAVPYHAWDNRAPGEMVVWIPETTAFAAPASGAK